MRFVVALLLMLVLCPFGGPPGALSAAPLAPHAGKVTLKPKARQFPSQAFSASARLKPLQCVLYVRSVSDFTLRGNAWTWWEQAKGRYMRGQQPQIGAVMVLKRSGRMVHGHVALVKAVINRREILVTHSNWGVSRQARAQIRPAMRVIDVSARNDWSQTRFLDETIGSFGRPYPTYGFIYDSVGEVAALTRKAGNFTNGPMPKIYPEIDLGADHLGRSPGKGTITLGPRGLPIPKLRPQFLQMAGLSPPSKGAAAKSAAKSAVKTAPKPAKNTANKAKKAGKKIGHSGLGGKAKKTPTPLSARKA
jgi:surface antigen